jgi:hypothetical protein
MHSATSLQDKIIKILEILLFTAIGIAVYWSGDFLYSFKPRVGALQAQFYEDDERLRAQKELNQSSEVRAKSEAMEKKMSAMQEEIQRLIALQRVAVITLVLSLAAYVVLIYFLVLRAPREEVDISRFG